MKDRKVRIYINRVLKIGLAVAAVLCLPGIILGGVWGKIAVGSVLALPLLRLSTEAYGFSKTGKPRYAVLAGMIILIILISFSLSFKIHA
ncbi:hypothetical protein Dip518_000497 [Parelusimicrobium proximum]|uniref:hypothetical protein n=1 Tax=Parelusimicrobium proximum TaxID=3228953 RepID=UPI003D17D019